MSNFQDFLTEEENEGVAVSSAQTKSSTKPNSKDLNIVEKGIDVGKAAFSGGAQVIPEIVDTASAILDFAEGALGIEDFVKSNAPEGSYFSEQGLVPDELDYSGFVKEGIEAFAGAPKTGVGDFTEGALRFGGSFAATGGLLKGLGFGAKAAKGAQLATASNKARSILNVAKEGLGKGALADFMATNEKDTLMVEFAASFSPEVQETIAEFVEDEDYSASLLKKKLLSIPEGVLFGSILNVGIDRVTPVMKEQVVDRIAAIFSRAKKGSITPEIKLSAEEAALAEGLAKDSEEFAARVDEINSVIDKVKNAQDPEDLTGKTYQGEELQKVSDSDDFAKASDISEEGVVKSKIEVASPKVTTKVLETLGENEIAILDKLIGERGLKGKLVDKVKSLRMTSEKVLENLDKGKLPNPEQLSAVGKTLRLISGSEKELDKVFGEVADDLKISFGNGKVDVFTKEHAEEMFRVHDVAPELVEQMIASGKTSAQDIQLFGKKLSVIKDEMVSYGKTFQQNPNSVEAAYDFLKSREAYDAVRKEFLEKGSTAGQALRHFGLVKGDLKNSFRSNVVRRYLQGAEAKEALKRLDVIEDLISEKTLDANAKKFLRSSMFQRIADGLYQSFVSNLLFGTGTQAKNVSSGALQLSHSAGARGILALGAKNAHTKAAAREYLKSTFSFNSLKKSFLTGIEAFKMAKIPEHLVEEGSTSATKALGHYDVFREYAKSLNGNDNVWSMALMQGSDLVSKVTKVPSRFLSAGDAFFKQLKFDATMSERVVNNVMLAHPEKGAAYAAQQAQKVINMKDGAGDIMSKYISNSDIDSILRQVEETTFTQAPNELMRNIQSNINGIAPLKWMMPFSRISMNMVRWSANNMPFIAKYTDAGEILAKGGLEAEVKQAEIYMTGLTVLTSMALLQDKITGAGPADRKERSQLIKTGWRPYSLKTANGYLDLKQFGSYAQFIAYGKLITNIAESLDEDDPDYMQKSQELMVGIWAGAQGLFVPGFISDSSFGVQDFVKTISSGIEDEMALSKAMSFAGGAFANAIIPGSGLVSRNKALFNQNDILEMDYKTENSLLVGMKRVLPWLDTTLKPQVDVFGEDRKSEIASGDPKNMDLMEELERLSYQGFVKDDDPQGLRKSRFLSPPKRNIHDKVLGEQVVVHRLSNQLYYEYQKATAGTLEGYEGPYGKTSFADKWRQQMKAGYPESIYGNSPEAVVLYLKELHKEYRDAAKDYIMSKDEVLDGKIQGESEAIKKRSQMLNIRGI